MSKYFFILVGLMSFQSEFTCADDAAFAKQVGGQLTKYVSVKVVDEDGSPIPGATITPWALRSSQGHGRWDEDDQRAEMSPESAKTDKRGIAEVAYPFYRDVDEQTRVFAVSFQLSHPRFTYPDQVHVNVPAEDGAPHEVQMARAASIELIPLSQEKDLNVDEVFVLTSDESVWLEKMPIERSDNSIILPRLGAGPCRFMLVRLLEGRAVAFSDPQTVELKKGANEAIELELHDAVTIRGKLSDVVPRPVSDGVVSALNLTEASSNPTISWMTWTKVRSDGTFEIDQWPRTESLQLIALSDNHIASNGAPPPIVDYKRDPAKDPFGRPQVFEPEGEGQFWDSDPQNSATTKPIEIQMKPLTKCQVKLTDEHGDPLEGRRIAASPNVGWWNWGSQVYLQRLYRTVDDLQEDDAGEPQRSNKYAPHPANGVTDQDGIVTLHLPAGRRDLWLDDEAYQLPIVLGRRTYRFQLKEGDEASITLTAEPTGREKLGDYDKLAGVVFGCSTREGKRICALPEVRKKMDEFAKRLQETKNPRDPKVLSEAFLVVAEAFEKANDFAEASKWRAKAEAEKAKL